MMRHDPKTGKKFKVETSMKSESLTTSSDGNSQIKVGQFTFKFLIDDSLNPNPPKISDNYTGMLNNTLVRGYQLAMNVFVETGSPVSDPTSIPQLINYTLSVLPGVVADTLGILLSQVIDTAVSDVPPITNIASKQKLKRNRFHAKSVTGVVLYTSFVIIALPNATAANSPENLAGRFVAAQTLSTIQANLQLQHLSLDTSKPINRTLVFVEASFDNQQQQPTTVVISSDDQGQQLDDTQYAIYSGVSLVFFIALCIFLCCYCNMADRVTNYRYLVVQETTPAGPNMSKLYAVQ
jgi:hypothetical protein